MLNISRAAANPLAALRTGDSESRPVVLVHGIFDSASCWFRVMEELASDSRRTIAVDLPGHGTTPLMGDDFTLSQLADAVVETLDRLGVRTFDLVGHSLGGLVAQQVALSRPESVSSLTLEDPAWGVSGDSPTTPPAFLCSRASELATWSAGEILRDGRTQHPSWDERDLSGWLEAKVDVDTGVLRAKQDWLADTGPDAWENYDGRVLLLTGDSEAGAIVTPGMVKVTQARLGDRLTHSHHPRAGHNIRKDSPSEFMAALREFLADD